MDVRVRVRLSVVAVFVLVLDVLVLVQGVRVGMRHITVRVLMGVLLHRLPPFLSCLLLMSMFRNHYALCT
ncbi:MAG: hypothetical protein ACRDSZ_16310 [Pseudonocardiaceae bacterium]